MTTASRIGIALLGMLSPALWATPAPPPTCSTESLTDYLVSGYECQYGDKIFSNFTFISSAMGGATAVTSDGVTVAPITDIYGNLGLEFNGSWTANNGQTSDSAIGFTVSVVAGGPLEIEDFGLAQTSGVTGNGSATVSENGCGPAPCKPGPLTVITFDLGSNGNQRVNDTIFTPVGSVSVSKDINVVGGTTPQTFSSISVVEDTFSQTAIPEPVTSAMLGAGLIGIGVLRRKRAH